MHDEIKAVARGLQNVLGRKHALEQNDGLRDAFGPQR